MTNKDILIDLFRKNVKGKKPDVRGRNERHDGKAGNWLEEQFGKHPDADNHADFFGYELKNETRGKTTFGDWSANEYVFTDKRYEHIFPNKEKYKNRWIFCRIFGKSNSKKGGRCSWSGQACPKYGIYNDFGQMLTIDKNGNRDVIVLYSFSKDQRINKYDIVPQEFQTDELVIARWYGDTIPVDKEGESLRMKLEKKFNVEGWFTCKMEHGVYDRICFGKPINYDTWLELFQQGIVFLDAGLHEGHPKPYSSWRANNTFWDSLITEVYY